uniref:Uncharacterized protein n=1 Tax=Ignisphaera aggregans TaxID=334771 RepID=A0A7C4BB53_9CREN
MVKQFKELVTIAKQVRSLYIVYGSSIDSVFSAALLLKFFKEQDVDVFLAPFYEASKPLGEGLVIGLGILQRPLSGIRFLSIDDFLGKDISTIQSTSLHLIKNIKDFWIIPRALEVIALSAMLSLSKASSYDENLVEIHKGILEECLSKDVWEYSESIRLFGYPRRDIVQALEKSIEPYIPGLTLDSDNCIAMAKRIREEAKGDVVSRLVEEVEKLLSKYSRFAPKLRGPKLIVKNVEEVEDVYEAFYAMSLYMDLKGPEHLLYIALEPQIMKYLNSLMFSTLKQFKPFMNNLIQSAGIKRFIVKSIRIGVVDISTESRTPPLYTLYRILKGVGLAEEITVFTNGKEFILPVQFLEPRWPLDKEMNIEKNYVILPTLQSVGDVLK